MTAPPMPYEEETRLVDAWLAARVGLERFDSAKAWRDANEAAWRNPEEAAALHTKAWRAAEARQWEMPEARAFLDLVGTARGVVAVACLRRVANLRWPKPKHEVHDHDRFGALGEAASRLVKAKGTVAPETYPDLVRAWISGGYDYNFGPARLVSLLDEFLVEGELPTEVRKGALELHAEMRRRMERWSMANYRRPEGRLSELLEPGRSLNDSRPEPWQRPFDAPEFAMLVVHARNARSAKPAAAWIREAKAILSTTTGFLDAFAASIDALRTMETTVDALQSDEHRGLAWFAGLTGEERAASLLGRMAHAGAHKIPNFGARAQKGFGAAVSALERMDGLPPLAALSQASHTIAAPGLAETVRAALARSAERQGIATDEIEEMVVPTYGLTDGRRTETFGDATAEIAIVGTTDVEVRWSRGGKALKSPPASVKTDHPEGLKELKRLVKEIGESLGAQRTRLERSLLSERRLPHALWRERYLDHPLLGEMARRLIWRFETAERTVTGISPGGTVVDAEDRPLEGLEEAQVSLWHPLGAGMATIEMWRGALTDREVSQPFKQAYREIYLLTDAERRTTTYSNRFAAHILKQHQFAALARARGWRYGLMGYWDGDDVPVRRYDRWGITTEFHVGLPEWNPDDQNELTTESGIARYLVTDSVRFVDDARREIPIADVPPLLFTEAMRDVDLFVGVASVGNDPTWTDQASRFGQMGAWGSFAFGALGASAETRRAALERLLPRLAIGPVAHLEGRFLVVRGRLRTYRIHLGSSNILMAPDDQYLCIVPSRAPDREGLVRLPFEGDGTLATILSKAMLLAKDHEIRDESILRQIRGDVTFARIPDVDAL